MDRISQPRLATAAVCVIAAIVAPRIASAESVVFANRSEEPVAFAVLRDGKSFSDLRLEPADVVSVAYREGSVVRFVQGAMPVEYTLASDSAYFFHHRAAGAQRVLELQQIGLAGATDEPSQARSQRASPAPPGSESSLKISVKLLVDDEEGASQRAWESRLRKRLAEASQILSRQARVSFEVTAVGTWDSDDDNHDFVSALREFETEVQAAPARLAIGFTSQYALVQGRTNLGGTRGALRSHILLREWSQHHSEPERLELLVHELGHFLGAAHSPEATSVMRPVLGDRQALARRFRISFDPLNALAMSVVGDVLRTEPVEQLSELPTPSRRRLSEVYLTLARSLPEDPAARHYLHWIAGGALPALPAPSLHTDDETKEPAPDESDRRGSALVAGARRVVAAIVRAAERNAVLPLETRGERPRRLVGDVLTELYVRAAAEETLRFRDSISAKALMLGLGVALDPSDLMRNNAATADAWRAVETDAERLNRLGVLGLPTMHDRGDLTQHFFVSAALAAVTTPTVAEAAGLAKELKDMQGASGFSFSDLSADLAGIALATRLDETEAPVRALLSFRVPDYLPRPTGLRDGLSAEAFATAFGSVVDPRFRDQLAELRRQIEALPSQRRP